MNKAGILGGMGPESTLLYYKEIASRFHAREPEGAFPALTIETVNMYEMLGYCRNGDYDGLTECLMKGIRNLEAAGADFMALASNTPHVVFDRLQSLSHVPMLGITEPVYEAIVSDGLRKICWLGTRFTMEQPYFRKLFVENSIEVVVPSERERILIDTVIAKELEFGIVNEQSRAALDTVIRRLVDEEDIQGIVLGCTELPLMYEGRDLPVPAYNTLEYHIRGILNRMFGE